MSDTTAKASQIRLQIVFLVFLAFSGLMLLGALYITSMVQIEGWGKQQLSATREHTFSTSTGTSSLGESWIISREKTGDSLADAGFNASGQTAPSDVARFYRDNIDNWESLSTKKIDTRNGIIYLAMRGFDYDFAPSAKIDYIYTIDITAAVSSVQSACLALIPVALLLGAALSAIGWITLRSFHPTTPACAADR